MTAPALMACINGPPVRVEHLVDSQQSRFVVQIGTEVGAMTIQSTIPAVGTGSNSLTCKNSRPFSVLIRLNLTRLRKYQQLLAVVGSELMIDGKSAHPYLRVLVCCPNFVAALNDRLEARIHICFHVSGLF
jgi:hypothetical protein